MEYGTRLEHAITELESCGDIEVERRPPDPDLTPERLELVAEADEYHADWATTDGRVSGEFCVRNIHGCLVNGDLPLTDEGLEPGERRVLRELKIFDEAPFGGAGSVTGLRVLPEGGVPEIWHYVSTRTMLHRLHLDYGTYLDTLLITKGATGWQYLFADVDLTEPKHADTAGNLTAMLDIFPGLFPGHDYEPLRTRLRERL
ncbi:hypothetical protein GCM10023196_024610 [Actinoallomurus vinaceus]|uniref:CYTH domain-containing protein n=1 Tax=Actinoallomurus vinaceus TaxID=1080074 RepID=A0ABP8U5Z1_9ACTN